MLCKRGYTKLSVARLVSKRIAALVLMALLALGVLIPSSPLFREMPDRDPGVFLYIGDHILHGQIPYRDVWDHKPPLIFYIDALGLFIGGGSVWGVWFLELVSLSIAAVIGFILLDRAFGFVPAVFGSVAWITSLGLVLEGGNYTEEFALPFQFAALYLFWQSEKQGRYAWRGFFIGVMLAACFLLKPTLVGVPLSVIIFLLLDRGLSRRWSALLAELGVIFAGAAVVFSLVVAYFAANNAFNSLVDMVLRYNFVYSTTTLQDKVAAVLDGISLTAAIAVFALVAWAIGMYVAWRARDQVGDRCLLYVSLIGLPVEFLLAATSGRSFGHYYIAWLPVFAVLMGFFAYSLVEGAIARRLRPPGEAKRSPHTSIIGLVALLLALGFLPARELASQVALGKGLGDPRRQAAQYVSNSTRQGDYVLVWGGEPGVNFIARREAPTRFIYQYPLYRRGYQSAEKVNEFLRSLMANRPALIIDTSPTTEFVPPIDQARRAQWTSAIRDAEQRGTATIDTPKLLPEMDRVFEYIATNYTLIGATADNQWPIYARK